MADDRLSNYLADLGALLKQEALDARVQALAEASTGDHQFALGRLTAYYEVLSLMRQQANAFSLDLADIALQGFDIDRELLASE